MKTLLLSVVTALLLSSCATHTGMLTGNASLTDANFKVVGLAVGQASTTHVLGIGGLKKDALVLEAKRNLYKNNPLTEGQALANVSVDFKRSAFPLVFTTKAMVSAEIIDFNEVPVDKLIERNDSLFHGENPEEWAMIVYKKKTYKAKVLKKGKQKSSLLFEDNKGIYKLKKFSNSKVYYTDKEAANYAIGDGVSFSYNERRYNGVIIAMNNKQAMIKFYVMASKVKYQTRKFEDLSKEFATN